MAMTTTLLRLTDLPARQLTALKRKARRLGITPESYIRQLIEEDLALDEQASRASLDELATPFRKAFQNASEADIDATVNAARRRYGRRSTPRGRSS